MKTAIILSLCLLSLIYSPPKEPHSSGKYKIYQIDNFIVMDIIVTKSNLPPEVLQRHCVAKYNDTLEVITIPIDEQTLIVRVKKLKTKIDNTFE